MSTAIEIAEAIQKLPADEAWQLAQKLRERLAELWDEELERDMNAGQLDGLVSQARADFAAGRTKPLDEVINEP